MDYKDLKIYIAGPECFYPDGSKRLQAMKAIAEAYGFSVSLPNDKKLKLDHEDKRKNADEIFKNCADSMNETDIIIADLEFFRGTEPDGGTIYEMGMAYGKGARCYGYTRDMRLHKHKHQNAELNPADGKIYDAEGRVLPEAEMSFNLMITSSAKVIEGTFEDALKVCILDLEDEVKLKASRDEYIDRSKGVTWPLGDRPRAYLAGPDLFEKDGKERGRKMKELCDKYGIEGVFPEDPCPGVDVPPMPKPGTEAYVEWQHKVLDRDQQHIRNCNVIIANLNDFHGHEPDSGTAWECGMSYQLGHKMYGFMDDTRPMIEKIACVEKGGKYIDKVGNTVENFDYPMNLMFSSSMKLFEGKFEDVIEKIAIDLGTYKK